MEKNDGIMKISCVIATNTRFENEAGSMLTYLGTKDGNACLVPRENYEKTNGTWTGPSEDIYDLGKDDDHMLHDLLCLNALEESYDSIFEYAGSTDGYYQGGRNGLLRYLSIKEDLKSMGYEDGDRGFGTLAIDGSPVTRESVAEAYAETNGYAQERALEQLDEILGTYEPESRKERLAGFLSEAIKETSPSEQKDFWKSAAQRAASQELMDSGYALQNFMREIAARTNERLLSERYSYADADLCVGGVLKDTLSLPSFGLSAEEKRVADALLKVFKNPPKGERAEDVLIDLAMGGKGRQERMELIGKQAAR